MSHYEHGVVKYNFCVVVL